MRRFLPDLMDRVLQGRILPGKAFDLVLPIDQVAAGYKAMDERRAIKTLDAGIQRPLGQRPWQVPSRPRLEKMLGRPVENTASSPRAAQPRYLHAC